jgi:hypothetical protein
LSWAGFLLFLLVLIVASDIGSMLIGVFSPAVPPGREEYRSGQSVEDTVPAAHSKQGKHAENADSRSRGGVPFDRACRLTGEPTRAASVTRLP